MGLYREKHVRNATRMILRAAAFNADGWLAAAASSVSWKLLQRRQQRLAKAA